MNVFKRDQNPNECKGFYRHTSASCVFRIVYTVFMDGTIGELSLEAVEYE